MGVILNSLGQIVSNHLPVGANSRSLGGDEPLGSAFGNLAIKKLRLYLVKP